MVFISSPKEKRRLSKKPERLCITNTYLSPRKKNVFIPRLPTQFFHLFFECFCLRYLLTWKICKNTIPFFTLFANLQKIIQLILRIQSEHFAQTSHPPIGTNINTSRNCLYTNAERSFHIFPLFFFVL